MQFWDTVSSSALLTLHSGRSAGKTEKVVFGKMVETDDGNISLIPIKIYEVESNISSQYKTISQKKTGDVEEVVVESLGPFTDAVTLTKKTWPTSEAKKSPTTLTPRPQTEAVTVTRKTWHTPEARKSPTTMSPVVVIKSIGSITGQQMTTTPSQKKLEETNILSTPKLVSKLFDETVLENEDNEFESTDNDPDYEPEDFNPVIKKRKKTMDDFELDEETNQYKCKICKHTFKHKKSVNGHMKRDCKEKCTPKLTEYELDETTNKYICKVCGKSLKSLQTLMAHKRDICKREPKHECFFCDYKGRNPTVLRVHIGKAHGKWGQLNKDGTWSYL